MHRDRGSLSGNRYRTRYDVGASSPDRVRDSGWQALPIQLISWKYRETRVALGAVPTDPCLGSTSERLVGMELWSACARRDRDSN